MVLFPFMMIKSFYLFTTFKNSQPTLKKIQPTDMSYDCILLPLFTLMACRSKLHLSTFIACRQKAIFFKKLMDDKDKYETKNMIEKEY